MKLVKLNESMSAYHCYDDGANEVSAENCVYLVVDNAEAVERFIDDCNDEYCRGLYEYTPSADNFKSRRLFAFDSEENIWREIPYGLIEVIKKKFSRG